MSGTIAAGTGRFGAEIVDRIRPARPDRATLPPVRVHLRRYSDIEPEAIRWLWPGRIACGKLTMLAGNPGLGKSQLTASMAAIVSRGGVWPDGGEATRGGVVILNAEDDAADTIGPRLIAARADLHNVLSLDAVAGGRSPDGTNTRRPFDLTEDLPHLRQALDDIGNVRLIIIDPISAYLGGTDSHKNAELRGLLAPLADLAADAEAAIVAVSHLNKSQNSDALMRVTGSLAFVAAARAAWLVAKDPDDDSQRLFLPLKNNIAKDGKSGLAFHIEGAAVPTNDGPIETSRIAWRDGVVQRTADEVMAAGRGGDNERGALDEAKVWLAELLGDGPKPAKQIRDEAGDAGLSWRTVQRAKVALEIKPVKSGYQGEWMWSLPTVKPKGSLKGCQPETLASFGESGAFAGDPTDQRDVAEVEL